MKAIWVRFLCVLWIAMCMLPGQALAADYDLTLADLNGGTRSDILPVSPVAEGATVTITIVIAAGWEVESVFYSPQAGGAFNNAIKYSDTQYYFTMPSFATAVWVASQPIQPILNTLQGGTEIPIGGSLTLSVQNVGVYATPTIDWFKEGIQIPGESGSTLTVTEGGNYHATVMDGFTAFSNVLLITEEPLSSENEILDFTIPGQVGQTILSPVSIQVTMPHGTDLRSLVPNIVVSDYATVSPLSGVAQDFTALVRYRSPPRTAAPGTTWQR